MTLASILKGGRGCLEDSMKEEKERPTSPHSFPDLTQRPHFLPELYSMSTLQTKISSVRRCPRLQTSQARRIPVFATLVGFDLLFSKGQTHLYSFENGSCLLRIISRNQAQRKRILTGYCRARSPNALAEKGMTGSLLDKVPVDKRCSRTVFQAIAKVQYRSLSKGLRLVSCD